ncbi:MAG TPA: C4-type zinc ribbon domain-containing protein [Ignavibacteria bacterium]|nr:C4-type zinc ribbon domain-containing protein [Ignavibacteria bacterium]
MDDPINNNELNKSGELKEGESRILEFFNNDLDSKKDKTTVLKMLYELTKVDKELADIKEEKGDLPEKISALTEKIENFQTRKDDTQDNIDKYNAEEKKTLKENKTFEGQVSKLDEQKYIVKNNKEYDEISKMIDRCWETLDKNEKRLKEIAAKKKDLESDMEFVTQRLQECIQDRSENQIKLDDVTKEYEEEENMLHNERKAMLMKLDDDIRNLYERINSMFEGEATAIVRKGNCSGCYTSLPPQREIEIKMAGQIFTCQSCGRILIDESLVSIYK